VTELEFETVDVFADRAFAGNPLAVVRGASGLSTGQLQALAREFNLSETAFPMEPTPAQAEAGAAYRLRIFTPMIELPFAGHPSVGTAWVLAQHSEFGITARSDDVEKEWVQACPAGLVSVRVNPRGARISAAAAPSGRGVEAVPISHARAAATAIGLDTDDLIDDRRTASFVASAGLPFWFLLVRESAVLRATAQLSDLTGLQAPDEVKATSLARLAGVAAVSWSDQTSTAHVRVFCPDIGMIEDPATGSAALALSAVLVGAGRLPATGASSYSVRQGAEIGRPSTLQCDLVAEGGRVVDCWVGGDVRPVARGRIRIPVEA
jgi:trans-2,3-dihydro-3-hydroxyanthranilate isomerase